MSGSRDMKLGFVIENQSEKSSANVTGGDVNFTIVKYPVIDRLSRLQSLKTRLHQRSTRRTDHSDHISEKAHR